MKIKNGFITHTVMGTQMMVAVGDMTSQFHGLVRSNETAAFIVDCLKKETTKEEVVNAFLEKYQVERSIAERDVQKVIDKLESIGAIE